jgi:hypothetical protein
MRKITAIAALLAGLPLGGTATAAPTAPTGEAGACNMLNLGAMHGMGTAVTNANLNGVLGMIVAINNTTPYGQPPLLPQPVGQEADSRL